MKKVKKMQAGGIKKASGIKKATTMNPTSRSTAMTALGINKNNQYSPSKFDDNVTSYARGTGAKKMQDGGLAPLASGNLGVGDAGFKSARKMKKAIAKKPSGYVPTSGATKTMKTGGMVNANAAVKKQTVPGSKGVMSGENPKATASKVAKGRSGGTSKAPKTAMPKAKYGMSMRKK